MTGGTMAATHVTKLTIQLRRLRIDKEQAQAIFYNYSTVEVPSGSGFAINTGLGALSCQVNGMTLDYFGPPKTYGQKQWKQVWAPAADSPGIEVIEPEHLCRDRAPSPAWMWNTRR
jgi:hypothetical protein